MVYNNYCCVLSEFLNPTEVEYLHGYARSLPIQEGRLGFDGKDSDSQKAKEIKETRYVVRLENSERKVSLKPVNLKETFRVNRSTSGRTESIIGK